MNTVGNVKKKVTRYSSFQKITGNYFFNFQFVKEVFMFSYVQLMTEETGPEMFTS